MNNFIIEEEFNILKIGSLHNKKRFMQLMSNMIKSPGKSIYSISNSRTEAKAAYMLLNNEKLDMDEISRIHKFRTLERICETEKPVLLVQDTTYVNYSSQPKKEGLGETHPNHRGVKIHSCIAITPEGLNLGVLHQTPLSCDPSETEHLSDSEKKKRPIEDKESYRWIESFRESSLSIPHDIDLTVISDREGDIYEYMHEVISQQRYFLTRIAQNRMTSDNQKVFDAIRSEKCEGEMGVAVPRNTSLNLQSRKVTLQIRFKKYEILRPANFYSTKEVPKSIAAYVIYAKEVNPPAGVEAIEWFLMTNRAITNFDEAVAQIKNYMQRWKIERFHYVLKSGGCNIERIQARSMSVTLTLIMLYSIISVFIMNMTYAARLTPDKPCSDYFSEEEWKTLWCLVNKRKDIPKTPYSIKEAVRYISIIGGGKRPPSDGDPGLKLIWWGLEKFYTVFEYKDALKLMVQD